MFVWQLQHSIHILFLDDWDGRADRPCGLILQATLRLESLEAGYLLVMKLKHGLYCLLMALSFGRNLLPKTPRSMVYVDYFQPWNIFSTPLDLDIDFCWIS